MYEKDVEELFAMVSYGTPVKLTYNVTKVTVSKTGQVEISVFPDVYYRGVTADIEYVKSILAKNDLLSFVSESYLSTVLGKRSKRATAIIRPVQIKINGKTVAEPSIATQENTYLPLKAFGKMWENLISEKEGKKIILLGKEELPVLFNKNTAYITDKELDKFLSGRYSWQKNNTVWSFEKTSVFLDKEKKFNSLKNAKYMGHDSIKQYTNYNNEIDSMVKEFNSRILKYRKIIMTITDNKDFLFYKEGVLLPFEKFSSGEQRLIIILLKITFIKPTLILIDEPELSLSMDNQEIIIDNLFEISGSSKIIVATHSPLIFDSFIKKEDAVVLEMKL
jgi:ABC-type transport system involved in cytochrome c biogenesis ATPase subunit